jgi:hypothetical protein
MEGPHCSFHPDPLTNVAGIGDSMNCLWRPCLLMDRDEIRYLYRGPSIDAPYQVSVHLAQWFPLLQKENLFSHDQNVKNVPF